MHHVNFSIHEAYGRVDRYSSCGIGRCRFTLLEHWLTQAYRWAPITDADPTACGRPQEYDANKEFAGKKVVIVSVPGAFTPGCQAYHLPPYIQNIDKLTKDKGMIDCHS